ncbi:sugar phosphate isomerase/epimerase family protein [Microbispora siamensis]|uniref:Inosose dehydratase n=1 Tax=Microbispora siamensis TaxID=564413 RepID=A0ABQ4GIW1_9ACTN|nr:sugar phosphate isomerase/epimerase [Microbispora siamensis]GIH61371.1 inosose dehydratase [Microbispora siamensis]
MTAHAAPWAVRVASAPVNFGVYRPDGAPLGPQELLATMREAGYDGTDSGPIGYLGTARTLPGRLAAHGLGLAGGWVDLRYDDPDGFRADLAALDAALDVFTAARDAALGAASGGSEAGGDARVAGAADSRFAPRPTLACPDRPERFARPGMPADPRLSLPDGDWPAYAGRIGEAAARCRDRGLEPVFHHHLGTDVETPEEVERLLDLTDVSLCLDTGHLWLAGGNPVAAIRDWSSRIRQVHVKDASRDVLARIRASGGDLWDLVAAGGFPPLGQGDLDLPAVLAELRRSGYEGWIVIEQDVPAFRASDAEALARAVADQRANRTAFGEALRAAGFA